MLLPYVEGLVSVIIINNKEEYLEKCIEGLLNQTYKNIEIIVVNICTSKVCENENIKFLDSNDVLTAKKVGINNAIGEYISFVSIEEDIESEMYENLLNSEIPFDRVGDFDERLLNKLYMHTLVDKFYNNLTVQNEELFDMEFSCSYLKELFSEYEKYDSIRNKLLYYMQLVLCQSIKDHITFLPSIPIPRRFIIDTKELIDKKIVLYGFGRMGQDVHWQLSNFNYNIVLTVDKNYIKYKENEIEVQAIEKMFDYEYDVILVAVSEEKVATEIRKDLLKMGVEEDKIIWHKPLRIF